MCSGASVPPFFRDEPLRVLGLDFQGCRLVLVRGTTAIQRTTQIEEFHAHERGVVGRGIRGVGARGKMVWRGLSKCYPLPIHCAVRVLATFLEMGYSRLAQAAFVLRNLVFGALENGPLG